MSEQKTLIYTSIYSNLYGTEFGGRPSREWHYKYSLLNLLNLGADKYICFTSETEIQDLKQWFYGENGIDETKLEFISFELSTSEYFQDIRRIRNVEEAMESDRCFEIQYNKFFWLSHLSNIEEYTKMYWFDAGLSHSGLIPEQFAYGEGHKRYYSFNLFNKEYLNYLNTITEERLVIVSKNNQGAFYWGQNIPQKYYTKYTNKEYIIGGFFGGNTNSMLVYRDKFKEILEVLLKEEKELYPEEFIMSYIYVENKNMFITLNFDDWYDRGTPEVHGDNVKYFYKVIEEIKSKERIFERRINYEESKLRTAIATLAIDFKNNEEYPNKTKNLIKSYLEYTDFDIVVLTDKVECFTNLLCERLKVYDYDTLYKESKISGGHFNMHLKRYPIEIAQELGYDMIYYHDCDCYITGWDDQSFNKKCADNFDVAFVQHAEPQLGGLIKNYTHFREKVEQEFEGFYEERFDLAPNPAETRVLFKNNEKLKLFLNFWDKISENNKDYFTYHDGVYFGTSAVYADMVMVGVTHNDTFSKYCRIQHGDGVLDYFGNNLNNVNLTPKEFVDKISVDNLPHVQGAFDYKGLQMLQHRGAIDMFKKLLNELRPTSIVEIGTEYGGLTLLLQDIALEIGLDTKIRTYDIKLPTLLVNHPYFSKNIEVVTKDIFSYNPFRLSNEGIKELKEFIGTGGGNLILCDGVNKSKEFNSISDIINSGDVIMLHDYVVTDEEFELNFKSKIWNWHEAKLSEIEEAITRNQLEPYLHCEFSKVVWGCFIKNK